MPDYVPVYGLGLSLEDVEKLHIRAVIADTASLTAAARVLGINFATLYRKRKKYGICFQGAKRGRKPKLYHSPA